MYSLRNCDAARHLYRVTSGLESMIVGEAEVQGQVKRAYELALAARTTGPLTNKLFRAALADRQARAHRHRDLRGPGERRLRRGRRRARRDRRPRRSPRADRRRRGDGRADRPGAARPGREHDVRRQPPPRARRSRSPSASAGRRAPSTRCPPSSSARTSSSPPPPRRTRCSGPRSSPTVMRAAQRAARCCWSTSPCRATSTPTASCSTASRCSTWTALQHRVAAQHRRAPRRGPARRGDRRGGDPDVRALAGLARGAADAGRPARARRRGGRPACSSENAGRWEALGDARPRAGRAAGPRGGQAAAARAHGRA